MKLAKNKDADPFIKIYHEGRYRGARLVFPWEPVRPPYKDTAGAFVDYVFSYLDSELSIFPVRWGGAEPLVENWREYMDRLPRWSEVSSWLELYGRFNIGLALGGTSRAVAIMFREKDSMMQWFWGLGREEQVMIGLYGVVVYTDKWSYVLLRPPDPGLIPRRNFYSKKLHAKVLGEKSHIFLPPSWINKLQLVLWDEEVCLKRTVLLREIPTEVFSRILASLGVTVSGN
jgi:hypothetical protein